MNNPCGFYISKLIISGRNVQAAEIEFRLGANLITGASNTGKSYVLGCINYLLGGADLPKEIHQSKGYNEGFLEIKTYEGKTYTLFRDIKNEGKIYYSETEQKYFMTSKHFELGERHGKNGLSNFLLDLSGFEEKFVRVNQQNKKRELSFRDIAKFVLVDEQRIIAEHSPIYTSSDSYQSWSSDQSVFSILLTGKDAKDLEEIEEEKVRAGRLKGKLELLKNLIEDSNKKASEISERISTINAMEIESQLENMNLQLSNTSSKIEDIEKIRQGSWNELHKAKSKEMYLKELVSRFELLHEHYKSDLARLEFVSEGDFIFSQLISKKCPVCDTLMDEEHINCVKAADIKESVTAEISKINLKLEDLTSTQKTTETEIRELTTLIGGNQLRLEILESELASSLRPKVLEITKKLRELMEKKSLFSEIQILKHQISEYQELSNTINTDLKKKPKKADIEKIQYSQIKDFCVDIENVLVAWKYPNLTSIEFDDAHKTFDFIISAIPRRGNGKGVRAITYSSFLFGLQQNCIRKAMPHPKFIIIDSPLTTYHGGTRSNKGDEVGADMQDAFFEFLSKVPTDRQVILMDNKVPTDEIQKKINFIYFGGPNYSGRKGFFPS